MKCENLILRKGEVRKCQLRGSYVIIDKATREVIEVFCTHHAERYIRLDLINLEVNEVRYTKAKKMSCEV